MSMSWDFSEEGAPEVFRQKNAAVCGLLEAAEEIVSTVDAGKLMSAFEELARPTYRFEDTAAELLERAKSESDTHLVRTALWLPFLTRYSRPGAAAVLFDGTPFVLGRGDYLFVAR